MDSGRSVRARRANPPRQPASGVYTVGVRGEPTMHNTACRPDADVARRGSLGRLLVIATREDVTMLREVIQVLGGTR